MKLEMARLQKSNLHCCFSATCPFIVFILPDFSLSVSLTLFLWQLTVLINAFMAVALLQTPVSVSLAGVDPTVQVVSLHLLLSVFYSVCSVALLCRRLKRCCAIVLPHLRDHFQRDRTLHMWSSLSCFQFIKYQCCFIII